MLILIEKIKRYLGCFFPARKILSWPRQSEVLIYDAANTEILLEYFKPWNPEILHVRGEQINLLVLLKSIFKKGRRPDAYIDCFIKKVRPRLVITTMDNSVTFYRISRRNPYIKTLFTQNGIRGTSNDVFGHFDTLNPDAFDSFFVDYMLVFGSTVGGRYSKYLKGNVSIVGSVKNNFVRKKNSSQSGVIAFVGHFRNGAGWKIGDTFFPAEKVWAGPDSLILQCLIRYAKEKKKHLVIIPSSHHSSELLKQEKDYFRELMGMEPEFVEPSEAYPSYLAVDSAEVVVSLESTLGYESIARGNKTAIFSIRSTLLGLPDQKYGWPADFSDEGPFWTNKPDPDIFVRILDYLFAVTDEQWKEDLKFTKFSSIMEYDPENTILQSIIEKELGSPPK